MCILFLVYRISFLGNCSAGSLYLRISNIFSFLNGSFIAFIASSKQGFANSIKRECEILPCGEMGNFAREESFIRCWESEKKWTWSYEPFSFCKFWTSIKMKINMNCVYKEYKIKAKMVQEQWLQLKMKFYWVITWKLLFSEGWRFGGMGGKGGGRNRLEDNFLGGWDEQMLARGTDSPIPPVGKNLKNVVIGNVGISRKRQKPKRRKWLFFIFWLSYIHIHRHD